MGKRRSTPSFPQQATQRKQAKNQYHFFTLGAVIVAAIAAVWAAYNGWSPLRKTVTAPEVPVGLRELLRCAEICDKGPTEEDKRFSENAIKRHGDNMQAHFSDLMKVCMWRCQEGQKSSQEQLSVPQLDSYYTVPPDVLEYLDHASHCAKGGLHQLQDAPKGLELCGTVHLDKGAIDADLVASVSTAFEELRKDSTKYAARVDSGHVRAGREEFWPPCTWPFNSSDLLQPPALMPILRSYLGPNVVFDHISIINAKASDRPQPQELHSDVGRVRRHVEVHLPLVDVSEDKGPTMFCPASQGRALEAGRQERTGSEFAVEWWYLSPGKKCADNETLSYKQTLKMGQVTIYDANVFHAGTANRAKTDRPIMQLSWAADTTVREERNYFGDAFKRDDVARKQLTDDVEAFRLAANMEPKS